MNVLLTNDDGFDSDGIISLKNALSSLHEVYIMAPSANRSAVSHSISMHSGFRVKKIAEKIYSCQGSPADCVFTALETEIFPVKFDCVISGINHGPNLGTDIIYSGTCAASREGSFLGCPSIAVSLDFVSGKIEFFEPMALFIRNNLSSLVSLCKNSSVSSFVNVNALSLKSYKGVVFTDILSRRKYSDSVSVIKDGHDFIVSERDGFLIEKNEKMSDETIVRDGFISVSLVSCEPSALKSVEPIVFSV